MRISRIAQALTGLILALVLSACGLHIRQQNPLPFTKIYTNIDLNTDFGNQLRLAFAAISPHTQLVNEAQGAQLQLIQLNGEEITHLTSINNSGQADEYELIYRFTYEILNAKGQVQVPQQSIERNLFVTYDASQASAESKKMELVFNALRLDVIPVLINQLNAPQMRQMLLEEEPYYGQ